VTTDAPASNERALRVLVVDDNPDAAELLGDMLSRAGFEVSVVNEPEAALASIATFEPDVAVLDIGLPGMDGYELAARMRQRSNCRLVALTGYGEDQDRGRSDAAGFESHLVKPVDARRLLQVVAGTSPSAPARDV
jgi:CheY-like chemotaxis protein